MKQDPAGVIDSVEYRYIIKGSHTLITRWVVPANDMRFITTRKPVSGLPWMTMPKAR
jgi:hypothetical protein